MKTELTPEEIKLLKNKLQSFFDDPPSGTFTTMPMAIALGKREAGIILSLLTKQEEQFNPCGEGENICNCKSESECGYLEQPQANDVEEWLKGWRNENCTEQAVFSAYHIDAMEAYHEAKSRKDKEKLKSYEDGFWGRMASKNLTKYQQAQEEIQSLKQANTELVKELSEMCLMARSLGWHEATTGRQIIFDSSEELLKRLSKHDKQ